MTKNFTFALADTVEMKKPHACQTNNWEVMRLGADIRLKCMGCGHVVMMPRADFNKKVKKLLAKANDPVNQKSDFYVPKEEIARPNFS
ncbi:Putative uncharacterized protein [Lactobacillus equicursoris DSM 19284 = JCM 14600 = CIP 110162]|uniref:DUF951 domain-containing protein n=3 Tax=Lactobacillus equicursoris TaxID=420645 RepID=K0NKP1_9LACO|nr:DUF951 domain-containing protein [Lactobacillus equicursoris]KRL03097.1 hypothetical protein FC20_GL001683 [Lactobacillus equicursoris DSM 19284 = JCM 14600 = CIP 110162]MDD6386163.1 DUF951 domain-containing protein [Lactobacillus equicursoris]MDD6406451.1 DUF951 domain-containing protein [Lactobacillus equicursoris]MST79534.1 DUF951 domain-containing protein [Lactobacillus equicursoris]CCK84170.1 Putative uncharacterized protein [Lactobacillus equicursoris 66c]